MINFNCDTFKAVRFEVNMHGDVEQYARNWLNICNNVRESTELLKCYNNSGSSVFVVCTETVAEATRDWLEWFGEITEVEEVTCIKPVINEVELTNREYDKLCEAEILPVVADWL